MIKVYKLTCTCGARLTSDQGCVIKKRDKYIHKCLKNMEFYGTCSVVGEKWK